MKIENNKNENNQHIEFSNIWNERKSNINLKSNNNYDDYTQFF